MTTAKLSASAAILAELMHGDGYGLDLMERVTQRSKGQVTLTSGNTYPALRQLEADGLVTSREGDASSDRGGRPRVYYRLTAEGRRAATTQQQGLLALLLHPQGV
ncbi:PadR family transcriptional regulator [Corallococcus sp. AS-1-6]|uniref:PadR family transcriptional regulator n=1 Tax=Corallococcus sp. AS-1-6 TaxID=2874599 RepID=UPI00359F5E4D